ncbi:Quinone oxidoreductase PIG3 [Mycena sanguinolenta]|uniref:Quinone oxidoreductase PIG3 n=1 Tax=Mycena sanguinolenta TaxID=230812 RepID=A0A8H7D0I8_9AGAR|nr:Quinone oxidoreductase PIG3 [Mycena sanguinolenta]
MRAVLIQNEAGPVENLYIGEVETPVPRANEVLIKAFGLNRMDISQRNGHYPPPAGSSTVLGVEFAGHIAAVGSDVSRWKIDDEVMGLAGGGAYAEYIVVLQTHVVQKPSRLSWAEAASIPECFLTAFQAMVVYGEVKPNDDVLVHAGASGVGVAAIQLARYNGAKTVIATASTQDKLDWLLSLPNGATNAANYKTQDFSQVTKEITQGRGVDIVIDFVLSFLFQFVLMLFQNFLLQYSGQSHFEKNLASLAVDGRMTMLALLSGPTIASVSLAPILYKRLRIQGSTLRSRTPQYQADLIARFDKEVLQHITGKNGDGPIKTYIHKVYSWNDIQDAHREMESNGNSGKIIAEVY